MRIAYLTSKYPDVSHTFILREVQALRDRGLDIATFSVRRSETGNTLGIDAEREAASTRWLLPPQPAALVSATAWAIVSRPLLTCRALARSLLWRNMSLGQRLKWVCYFGEALLLAHWLVRACCEHLHCHFGNSGSSTGMLAALLADIPFSMTCHGSELSSIRKFRLAEKIERAAFVACVSHHGKARLMHACQPKHWDKLRVVRVGMPPVAARPRIVRTAGPSRILCVARLSREKGHLVLFDALAELRDSGVDFQCTLVGDGPMRLVLEQRLVALRLTARVRLTGSLEPDRVALLYEQSDVVVLSSFSEGVPVVLMEAMAHGRPVVATRVGGVPELVQDGQNGQLVEAGDAHGLARGILRVLEDPPWAENLARHAAESVSRCFDIRESTAVLIDLFNQTRRTGSVPSRAATPNPTRCTAQLAPQDS